MGVIDMNQMIDTVRGIVRDSNNVVVLSGLKLMQESGLKGIREDEQTYEVETKFGYTPDEIMTTDFLMKRVDMFYEFYREYILDFEHMHPTPAHYAMASLEQQGKLSAVITRTVMGLHQMAGIYNVIELYGNVQINKCTRCGKEYPINYIAEQKPVPRCEHCGIPLKPGMALFGERLDNGKMSKSIEKVSHADVLILAGTSITSYMSKWLLPYYEGEKLIVVKSQQEHSDEQANYKLYGKCMDILPQIF